MVIDDTKGRNHKSNFIQKEPPSLTRGSKEPSVSMILHRVVGGDIRWNMHTGEGIGEGAPSHSKRKLQHATEFETPISLLESL